MFGYDFDWSVIPQNFDFLMSGLGMTLLLSFICTLISIVGGLALAALGMSPYRICRGLDLAIGELIRNTPILVQLFWVYYVIPILTGLRIDAVTAAIIGLSLYSSAFVSEIYRAGLQAVPRGQLEAAQVLGMSAPHTFFRIQLPQAIRMTLPPLAANFVQLIKYSSLASVFGVADITRKATELSASTFRPMEIFTFIAVVYFLICYPISLSIRVFERRLQLR
jgi:polar amino acid transport system permease protein